MRNLKLVLSWDGSNFKGFQIQPHVLTAQEVIQKSWKILTHEDVTLIGCSRLDAEVHAYRYVLNFKTATKLDRMKIIKSLNGIFYHEFKAAISLLSADFVEDDFHSRFHAKGKHYRYLIWQGVSEHALLTRRCFHVKCKNEIQNLPSIMAEYVGFHHFGAFRASDCFSQKLEKTIYEIDVWDHPHFSEMKMIDIWGDGFLKHMIRNMVGTAIDIATKKLSSDTIQKAFEHHNRTLTGVCAPGCGLTLMNVYYDEKVAKNEAERKMREFVPC